MNNHDDAPFDFEELDDDEYTFDSFEDEKLEDECDLFTVYCQTFIIEHNLPDDTDPTFIRQRVWWSLGVFERLRFMFKGIRP